MTQNRLVLGTRGSQLALTQSNWVAKSIAESTGIPVFVRVISTKGDRILHKPLAEIGGKGLFTVELETELLQGTIDFAVHSLKDLPTDDPEGLCLGCVPKREDPRDAFVGPNIEKVKIVGTGSARRAAQIAMNHPHVEVRGIRGNVDTRLSKLDEGKYDLIVLAMAGLNRLEIQRSDITPLAVEQFVPAPGQGALGIQCRAADNRVLEALKTIECLETSLSVSAERSFLSSIGGGCNVAAGCNVSLQDGRFHAHAFLHDSSFKKIEMQGDDPIQLGKRLALELIG